MKIGLAFSFQKIDRVPINAYDQKLDEYPDGSPVPDGLPNAYRLSENDKLCSNCSYYEKGQCTRFNAAVKAKYVCNAWKANE